MADQLVVVGTAPVAFDDLKRVQVKLKSDEGDEERQAHAGLQAQAMREHLLELLGPDVAIEIVEDSALDVICSDSVKKAIKKTLKKEKKTLNISVNKKVDDAVDHEVLRNCLEKLCESSLISKGWSACKNNLYLRSNLGGGDESVPVHSVRLSMHLEAPNKIVLVIRPDVVKFRRKGIVDILPTIFKEKFLQGKPVELEEWLDTKLEEDLFQFRCFCVPSLEHGQIIGCYRDPTDSGPNAQSITYWRKKGIEISNAFFTVMVKLDHGARLRLPSTCVFTEAGLMPVPGTTRSREMQTLFASIGSAFSWTFFGTGNVQFKNSERGSLPVMVQTTAWTTVKGMVGLSSTDAMSARSLTFAPASCFRRPKPALPVICETPKIVQTEVQEPKIDDESAEETPKPAKVPEPVPAIKLAMPVFTSWKQRASSGNTTKPAKSSAPNAKGNVFKRPASSASAKENKGPEASFATKAKKLDDEKPASKKAKTAHAAGKGSDAANQGKASAKKKPESKPDDEDNTSFVKAKFKEGKLKDVTLPRLKSFITFHKLGKVSGKKDELLLCVEKFLAA